ATATHDTKRGEDARLRIDVLSEMPDEWKQRLDRWSTFNRSLRREIDERWAPSANEEYFLYQALLGAWPAAWFVAPPQDPAIAQFGERFERYAIKALREAKTVSSWENPNEPYESALKVFVGGMIDLRRASPFLADFVPFAERVARFGMLNSLSQTVLRLTVPGVPDTYQGTEFWDLAFVDPDNRQPVDFAARQAFVPCREPMAGGSPPEDVLGARLVNWHDGAVKLLAMNIALDCRRRRRDLFLSDSYEALATDGSRANNVVAFRRQQGGQTAIVAAARRFVSLLGENASGYAADAAWDDTAVLGPGLNGVWREALTDAEFSVDAGAIPAATILGKFPAAILLRSAET
ncbi:MAG: malto-oligosyltrehalose synthase, partial [Alphaproteobacteria bacterium]